MNFSLLSDPIPLLFSVSLFAAAVCAVMKGRGSRPFLLLAGGLSLAYLMLTLVFFVSDSFTADGINAAVLYHVEYGLAGAGFAEYGGVITSAILFLGLSLLLVAWGYRRATVGERRGHPAYGLSSLLLFLFAFHAHPATGDIRDLVSAGHSSPGDFHRHYRPPSAVKTGRELRNLVFIYAESLERTYFDETLFPGLIRGLRELEGKSTSFTRIGQAAGTGWTIAGMVASQCGIPLVSPSHGNSMAGMDVFLPNAVCLGDLLARKGYRLSYLGGADLFFAGKGKFYSTHRFDDVAGQEQLEPLLPESYSPTPWGLYDDTLLEIAYDRFTELAGTGGPFGLFLLTLDTHHPRGDPSPSCGSISYGDGSNPILNAVACSDHLISEFVDRIRRSPEGRNTVVVIASDHLSMRNTAYDLLTQGERSNLFMILDPSSTAPEVVAKRGSLLDVGPTLMPRLGLRGSLGLGRDLAGGEDSLATLLDPLESRMGSWREDLEAFWAFPRWSGSVTVDLERNEVGIEGRTFGFPVLVEIDRDLETTMKFDFGADRGHRRLSDHVAALVEGTPFLWIDRCGAMQDLDSRLYGRAFCLIMARAGSPPVKVTRIREAMRIRAEEVEALVSGAPVTGSGKIPKDEERSL